MGHNICAIRKQRRERREERRRNPVNGEWNVSKRKAQRMRDRGEQKERMRGTDC
jgi:hypothetical protein